MTADSSVLDDPSSVRGPALVAEMTLRALLRRRLTMAILIGLPILFSFAARDSIGQSVRALVFGTSWAMSTAAFFATSSSREVEPRLRLAGWPQWQLAIGRIAGLSGLGMTLVALFWVVVAIDHEVRSLGAVWVDLAVTAVVAVGVGTTIGTLIHREMEGALVLFLFAGLQAVVNPFDTFAKFLPFWSSRELGTFAIDGPSQGSLVNGLAHGLGVVALCCIISWAVERRSDLGWPRR
ncbi:MAG: hypothetical protein GY724_02100 [Actinomycetia bacterium]|nr:hypothetical protein [Actinomycetes bacterium]